MSESAPGTGGSYEGDILQASSPGAGQIEVGMAVVSVDGQPIGQVKEVREGDFLLDRPMAHDLYVPYRFVMAMPEPGERVRGGPHQPAEVMLNVSAAHIDEQGWQRP
jgi:hypothetical protein